MMSPRSTLSGNWTAVVTGLALLSALAPASVAEVIAVRAAKLLGADGTGGAAVILIEDGKIVSIGPDVQVPDGATVIEADGQRVVTAGLVDANCTLNFEIPQLAVRWSPYATKHDHEACEHADRVVVGAAPDLWRERYLTDASPIVSNTVRDRESAMASMYDPSFENGGDSLWDRHDQAHRHGVSGGQGADGFWWRLAEAVHIHAEAHAEGECLCGRPPAMLQQATARESFALGVPTRQTWTEHAAEIVAHLGVIDSLNLLSSDFDRLVRSGVTTVFVAPDTASVIGMRGAIVKTAGKLDQRVVREHDAVLAAMGGDPSYRGRSNRLPPFYGPAPSVFTRRPTTRMGVDFVFRKAFYDAVRDGRGLPLSGADVPPTAALPVLRAILKHEVPLRIQARLSHDILSALRLSREFEFPFTLTEATEAYAVLPQLKAADVPVIYGPIFMTPRGWRGVGEADDPRLDTPRRLHARQIPFALTASDLRDEEGLARQALFAVRYGLPRSAALRAVTETPAQMMGLADRLGRLTTGTDADLVIWNDDPFSATSRPVLVLIDGQVVYEG